MDLSVLQGAELLTDMLGPPELPMDSDYTPPSPSEEDFGFAFNDSNFSDRVLRIEIMGRGRGGPSNPETEGCGSIADWARHRKRRREDNNNNNSKKESVTISDVLAGAEEQILSNEEPDMDEGEAMIEEALSGDEEEEEDDATSEPAWGLESFDYFRVKRVRELHISSPILAAKSPFFYKLFSNGMMESVQRHVTLVINASEEAALMDVSLSLEEAALMELLNFMYTNTVSVTTAPALLDVLMAADKFEVASCMRYCSRLLRNMPMTTESALLYLELPATVLLAKSVQPLTDAAKLFLAARYKDVTKFPEEFMSLPLAGVEAVLSSDDLQVASEDAVYDLILKWARAHYPSLEERREVLGSRLARSIRFPFMTCRKLKKVLTCSDFEHEKASKLVLEALFFKAEAPHRQRSLVAEESASTSVHHRLIERAYRYRPVKVVEFELPRKQCVVYLDLKREECTALFPSGRVYSQAFHLGGQGFFLSAHCNMDHQSSFHCFGLFLGMQEKGPVSFGVDYEFSARSKPTEEFISKYKGNYTFTGGKAVGYRNMFGIPWTSFVGEESDYFINGILHLKAELAIRRNKIWVIDENPPPLHSSESLGKSFVDLLLKPSEEDLKQWPHSFELRLRVSLAVDGDLTLISRVRNINGKPFSFLFAYHTYLSVSDISEVRVEGLETLDYLDNLSKRELLTEQGDAITFESEMDRTYLRSPRVVAVLDHERKRTYVIRKEGLPDTVVWNPWEKKSKSMADFGDEEYKSMLCVDGAAIERPITLKPGEEWTGRLMLTAGKSSFCFDQLELQSKGFF
ncbi:hypothetical protein Bca101_021829 [Brassica carinata]